MREDDWMRDALNDALLAEIDAMEAGLDETARKRYEKEAADLKKNMEKRLDGRQSVRRGMSHVLRMAAVAALVLCIGFGGMCAASAEFRESVAGLVQSSFGRSIAIILQPGDEEATVTVQADDPRLRYVHPDWCLHYYPLEMRSYFDKVSVTYSVPQTPTMLTLTRGDGSTETMESGFYYLTDEARARIMELGEQEVYFVSSDDSAHYYASGEDGSADAQYRLDAVSQDMVKEVINGKEVYVITDDGLTTFVWYEGGCLLTLASTEPRYELEYVFSTVERIR